MSSLEKMFPIPNLESCKRILCIQPHPDDNEIGAGATIAKLADKGCEIFYLTATDGRLGTSDPFISPQDLMKTRDTELRAAAKVLGAQKALSLGLRDCIPEDVQSIAVKVAEVIREIKPQMLMTVDPWLPYEAHPDHRKVGMAVVEAMLFSGFPLYPKIEQGVTFPEWHVEGIALYHTAYPNTYIDVTGYLDKKIESISHHKSQFDQKSMERLSKYVHVKASEMAKGKPFESAESFKVLGSRHMHCFVDAINI